MKLSIIVPVWNEPDLPKMLEKLFAVKFPWEIEVILVDDGSTDGTREWIEKNGEKKGCRVILQSKNRGKGFALRTGFKKATGDVVVVQDADLEYDPEDFLPMLELFQNNQADVVYGSRFTGNKPHRALYFANSIANKFLTFLSNLLTGLNLTDMETCYKMFSREVLDDILPKLSSDRFGFEPEVTARISKNKKWRVYEIGISYFGRTLEDGKKIGWKDGVAAVWYILKFNLFVR